MKKSSKAILSILVVFLAIAGLFAWDSLSAGQYNEFALCLEDKGAIFYGAFWCSNCNEQKALFGKSAKKLPYTECSPPNRQGQFPACTDAVVQAYPTWEFADGSREVGVQSFNTLAERTGCELPK